MNLEKTSLATAVLVMFSEPKHVCFPGEILYKSVENLSMRSEDCSVCTKLQAELRICHAHGFRFCLTNANQMFSCTLSPSHAKPLTCPNCTIKAKMKTGCIPYRDLFVDIVDMTLKFDSQNEFD